MRKTTHNQYDAAFKLQAIELAITNCNRAAARELGIHESMVRQWRSQRGELQKCKKTQIFSWPELENKLEDWVNTQRSDGQGVSTVQIRLKAKVLAKSKNIENFGGGLSWCMRFMRRKGLSVRARTTMCQALPTEYQEKMNLFRNFTREKMEDLIGPNDVINMDEVPLTFDLPLTRTMNKKMRKLCDVENYGS
jgi:hypothetical protein